MASITVGRLVAADPTSAALLVAGITGVPPRRRPGSYAARFVLHDHPATLTLAYTGADPVATSAVLTVAGGGAWLHGFALDFLARLATLAEARADAA